MYLKTADLLMSKNIQYLFVLFLAFATGCQDAVDPVVAVPENISLAESFFVHINLNDRSDDTFKVEMFVDGLSANNDILQFASTVPGTYDIIHAGRFVRHVKVYDPKGQEVKSEKISTNQWRIDTPTRAYRISYQVLETFDTPVDEHPIYAMAGTSIEEDHVLLNTSIVIPYPSGLKERDYYISLSYPEHWSVGTAFPAHASAMYQASDFDHLSDSPILLGEMNTSSTTVDNTQIHVHVYSAGKTITSSQVLRDVEQVLLDARAFLKTLPTDRYDFLYHFGDVNAGALEHSKSSVYVLQDRPYSPSLGAGLKSISAHEFFHIVTPLNIQSEIIADFNFAVPIPSQHLWLYEGVTEWASDFMQFRNGSMTLDVLLGELKRKLEVNASYDPSYSLVDISTQSYTKEGNSQFINIYHRGAFVISLLDIRLLELSDGKKGMREVILELINRFGPNRPFSETDFFDTLVRMTYPEIENFINDYIKGTKALPIQSYYAKIGVRYDASDVRFTPMENLSTAQKKLFDAWARNL